MRRFRLQDVLAHVALSQSVRCVRVSARRGQRRVGAAHHIALTLAGSANGSAHTKTVTVIRLGLLDVAYAAVARRLRSSPRWPSNSASSTSGTEAPGARSR